MNDDIAADVEAQIATQGVASYKVSDGEVFVFTSAVLEGFLEAAKEKGRVIVFVKTRAQA